MLVSRMRGHDASPGIPARWMTAPAPWQAAVIASRSVTDAWIASSPGPAVRGQVDQAQRPVRPGQPGPQHGSDQARGPGDDDDRHRPAPVHIDNRTYGIVRFQPGHRRYQVATHLFISQSGLRLEVLMGMSRGSLTLPRMNAHRLVIIAARSRRWAAALATALATFSGQALPRAVRHDLGHATGTSLSVSGSVNASQAAQYTSILPSRSSRPWAARRSPSTTPTGPTRSGSCRARCPPPRPPRPPAGGMQHADRRGRRAGRHHRPGRADLRPLARCTPSSGQPIPAALPATAAALLHVTTGDVLRMRDRDHQGYVRFVVTGLYRPRQVSAAYWNLSLIAPSGSTRPGLTTFGPLLQPAEFAAGWR